MIKKWSFFGAAAVLGAYALLTNGAPLIPVITGIGLGALLTARTAHFN